jgi:hypothetical protein
VGLGDEVGAVGGGEEEGGAESCGHGLNYGPPSHSRPLRTLLTGLPGG